MTTPILITGGTGTLGRHVVARLTEADWPVRVLSRGQHPVRAGVEFVGGDLTTGRGVAAAVAGAGTVLHLAGAARGDDKITRTLVEAAARAGVGHLVLISVVGADRVPGVGYYERKLASERLVADSAVPWTTLRATQFHDLMLKVASGLTRLPVIPVLRGMAAEPVDADEVAARLVELAQGDPAGLVPELAGPRRYDMPQLIGSYLAATGGRRRPMVPLWLPGRGAAALRAGGNLLSADAPAASRGHRTWEEFLADRVRQPG